ncbi:hypothetical protein ACP70R_037065 [Stipagrostis hirtigluma subsp. patula]
MNHMHRLVPFLPPSLPLLSQTKPPCPSRKRSSVLGWRDPMETEVVTVRFEGDEITATVTSSGEAVEDWLDEVLSVHRRRLHKLIVGLDVEWRPTFSEEYSPTALLQLCVGRRCLIFQLLHADDIPDELHDFLGDPDFRFVGVGVEDDADRLYNDYDLEVANTVLGLILCLGFDVWRVKCGAVDQQLLHPREIRAGVDHLDHLQHTVDLRELAAEEMDRPDLRRAGLKTIASAVMDVDMRKPHAVRTGPWDAYCLSDEQIDYACIDAFVSFEVGRKLLSGDY